jgi:hypothetical protein
MDSSEKAAWGTQGQIYSYETKDGTRWRFSF